MYRCLNVKFVSCSNRAVDYHCKECKIRLIENVCPLGHDVANTSIYQWTYSAKLSDA